MDLQCGKWGRQARTGRPPRKSIESWGRSGPNRDHRLYAEEGVTDAAGQFQVAVEAARGPGGRVGYPCARGITGQVALKTAGAGADRNEANGEDGQEKNEREFALHS